MAVGLYLIGLVYPDNYFDGVVGAVYDHATVSFDIVL
jgi:hypothetical protein